MPHLFDPLVIGDLRLPNRAWLSPMCQYSVDAHDGVPTDWHLVHLGSRAAGGFGLVMSEATAIAPEGRISLRDTGLWNDEQERAWARIVDFVHGQGSAAGIQLSHAGRKASTPPMLPGVDLRGSVPESEGGWQTVAPSALAVPGQATPRELPLAEIGQVVEQFRDAAARADRAGFDVIELHAAHGYLLHQFLSPLSNHREDAYGGSFNRRIRLVLEVVEAVREVWPVGKPLFVRLSATDWIEGGWDLEQSKALGQELKRRHVDLIDVSSGGLLPAQITAEPLYQVPFAHQVRFGAGLPTSAVGLVVSPAEADGIVAGGDADAVMLGREALRHPYWPQMAARSLSQPTQGLVPDPYFRSTPRD
ncbi:NADH:flavin oxidoreductase/NADH oxidase [Nigerium massiliense]|uniref:NADH:flavin oxidoreductase/NADH oxidase n=1 Tax=Nigerium massiliense TaxID=1522317 RepID=UPI00058FA153|nr:NADH:flavin oxidoreductase/NADH oxidase [Nigerium massiliense]